MNVSQVLRRIADYQAEPRLKLILVAIFLEAGGNSNNWTDTLGVRPLSIWSHVEYDECKEIVRAAVQIGAIEQNGRRWRLGEMFRT